MTEIERHSYDVVVIGAGGAGLRAAIEARELGKRTAVVCKSLFGKAHTVMAEGGIAASMGNVNSRDSWQVHFRDTMRGGKFLNSWRMAELHAKEAPQRVWELETYGALFDRTKDGKISQRNFGGHEYPRLAHVGDRTGLALINMEFVQIHPTGMVWPPSVKGILVTESVRGDGGVLRNSEQQRFMFDYIPDVFKDQYATSEQEADRWYDDPDNNRRPPELLPRDEVARAINSEVKAGRGSPHGGVFLDIASRRTADDIRRRLPSMYHQFKELADVDITAEAMEVGPTCHYVMGGVEVDPDTAAARVPGLFAAGEVAGGMHGSNRLGGNSLSDLLVFGRRAGLAATEHARSTRRGRLSPGALADAADAALAPFEREG